MQVLDCFQYLPLYYELDNWLVSLPAHRPFLGSKSTREMLEYLSMVFGWDRVECHDRSRYSSPTNANYLVSSDAQKAAIMDLWNICYGSLVSDFYLTLLFLECS